MESRLNIIIMLVFILLTAGVFLIGFGDFTISDNFALGYITTWIIFFGLYLYVMFLDAHKGEGQ